MKDMILFPEDIERLNQVLSQLVAKSNLLMAVLINKDGRLLTSQGSLESNVDIVSMAALVAGNSASTLAIAQLVGETEFCTMYHQGKDKHIYISIVDENTFMALVFDDRTNIDRVKVFARQFDKQIKQALFQVYNKQEEDINLDLDLSSGFDNFSNQQQNYDQGVSQTYAPSNLTGQSYEQQQVFNNFNDSTPPPPVQKKTGDTYYLDVNEATGDPSNNSSSSNDKVSGNQINTPDTKYLYLQNKIRETVKKKKEEN